jgi:outer membrane protein assembly factor BamB
VVTVILGVAGVAYALRDEAVRGPSNPFPQPVAGLPPLHSAQLVATTDRRPVIDRGGVAPLIYSGLAIVPARDGVRAVNIATGKVYWRYRHGASFTALDAAAGDVFVLGDRLAAINIRSGRVRWSRPVPDVGGGAVGDPADDLLGDAGAGMMAVIGESGIAGLDRASGHLRWTKPWPPGCSYFKYFSSVAIVGRTLAVTCGESGSPDHMVVGFDSATGTQRWTLDASRLFPEVKVTKDDPDAAYELSGIWTVGGLLAVGVDNATAFVDPATGRTTLRRTWHGHTPIAFIRVTWDGSTPTVFSDGIQISACSPGKADLCGDNPSTGKALWHRRIPEGRRSALGRRNVAVVDNCVWALDADKSLENDDGTITAVQDGCVYTVSDRHGAPQLVVFNARTGGLLGQITLPDRVSNIIQSPATGGVIDLFDGSGGDDLLAERPDLHTSHNLSR